MKKTYTNPSTRILSSEPQQMMATSTLGVGSVAKSGSSSTTPIEAGSRTAIGGATAGTGAGLGASLTVLDF